MYHRSDWSQFTTELSQGSLSNIVLQYTTIIDIMLSVRMYLEIELQKYNLLSKIEVHISQ